MVTVKGAPVLTQFSSSNGGASAASPLAHMVARADPVGRPGHAPTLAHSWRDTVTARTLAARNPTVGTVRSLEVLTREGFGPWGGRIAALRIVGARGSPRGDRGHGDPGDAGHEQLDAHGDLGRLVTLDGMPRRVGQRFAAGRR